MYEKDKLVEMSGFQILKYITSTFKWEIGKSRNGGQNTNLIGLCYLTISRLLPLIFKKGWSWEELKSLNGKKSEGAIKSSKHKAVIYFFKVSKSDFQKVKMIVYQGEKSKCIRKRTLRKQSFGSCCDRTIDLSHIQIPFECLGEGQKLCIVNVHTLLNMLGACMGTERMGMGVLNKNSLHLNGKVP